MDTNFKFIVGTYRKSNKDEESCDINDCIDLVILKITIIDNSNIK